MEPIQHFIEKLKNSNMTLPQKLKLFRDYKEGVYNQDEITPQLQQQLQQSISIQQPTPQFNQSQSQSELQIQQAQPIGDQSLLQELSIKVEKIENFNHKIEESMEKILNQVIAISEFIVTTKNKSI